MEVEALAARQAVLSFDAAASASAAAVAAALAAAGRTIGPFDTLIAGHAHSLDLVVTGNGREFGRVAGLVCEDWAGS